MRARRGFTLAEVAVAALIVAIMAAVTAPSLMSFLDNQRAMTTASTLSDLATGIGSFRTSVGAYPQKISQLTNVIATTQLNSCGAGSAAQTFTAAQVTNWNNNAPFVTFFISSTSPLNTPLGTITDLMVRNPVGPSGTLSGTLAIRMSNVDSADAAELDKIVDGTSTPTTGVLQYTITGSLATISYFVPVGNRC